MAISTLAGINAALPGDRNVWMKLPTGISVGNFYSAWTLAGSMPLDAPIPSSGLSGDIPTDASQGSFPFVNPASGNSYVARMKTFPAQTNFPVLSVFLYDRLWHNSGIDRTSTAAQTINSVALTRPNANGDRVEAWWEVYVAMGTGTPTVTLTYTNDQGTASRSGSSGALSASMGVGRTGQFQLASGDVGVRSIQTWQGSATFGTSGTIGLVMRRLVTAIAAQGGASEAFDALSLGLPRVYDDACLEFLFISTSTSNGFGQVNFNLIQG